MDKDKVRVIKISKEALLEYIYEKFVTNQDMYLDVDKTEVSDYFEIDHENGSFIFCAMRSEDEKGNFLTLPADIELKKLIKAIPDTTDSMFSHKQKLYKEYTKNELADICRGEQRSPAG